MFLSKGQKGAKGLAGDPGTGHPGLDGPQGVRGASLFISTQSFMKFKNLYVVLSCWLNYNHFRWFVPVCAPCVLFLWAVNIINGVSFEFCKPGVASHVVICSLQVYQVTRPNPKTAWRVPKVPEVSLERSVSPAWSGTQACRDSARRATAAFTRRWCVKSRVWWKDPSVQRSEPEHEELRSTWRFISLNSSWSYDWV